MSNSKCVITLFLAIIVSATCANANLLVNGSFEDGNVGFVTDFTYNPTSIFAAQTYTIIDDPHNAHSSAASYRDHTSGTGLMMAVNGSTDTTAIVWEQTVPVSAASIYEFSLYTSTWYSLGALQIAINGADVGPEFTSPVATGVWEQTTASWSSRTATSAQIRIINTSSGFNGNDFALDDLSLTDVTPPDIDNDGILNASDNCPLTHNPGQRDTDADLIGNFCDPDFNNDCAVNFVDLDIMRDVFFSSDPEADLDSSGIVNFADLQIMQDLFFGMPGPGLPDNHCAQ